MRTKSRRKPGHKSGGELKSPQHPIGDQSTDYNQHNRTQKRKEVRGDKNMKSLMQTDGRTDGCHAIRKSSLSFQLIGTLKTE